MEVRKIKTVSWPFGLFPHQFRGMLKALSELNCSYERGLWPGIIIGYEVLTLNPSETTKEVFDAIEKGINDSCKNKDYDYEFTVHFYELALGSDVDRIEFYILA